MRRQFFDHCFRDRGGGGCRNDGDVTALSGPGAKSHELLDRRLEKRPRRTGPQRSVSHGWSRHGLAVDRCARTTLATASPACVPVTPGQGINFSVCKNPLRPARKYFIIGLRPAVR